MVLGERHFHFSIAFLSLLASALVIAVIVDMARRRNRNTCGFFHHVKDFDMLMIPLFLCQFGNSWIQMAAAIPRWGGLKFSPSTVDDSHNDDTPFDPFMRGLYMSEFFSKFVFPDVSCLVINVLSFSVVWIVCRQRKLPVLERYKCRLVVLTVVLALIPGIVWVSARFNAVDGYQRPVRKNGAAVGEEEQAMTDRYFWFLNRVEFYNIVFRVVSIVLDSVAVVVVVLKLVEFRNPQLFGKAPDVTARARSASLKQASDFAGEAAAAKTFRSTSSQYRSIRGCPMLELCKRMAFFPLIQCVVTAPIVIHFFVYLYDGGMYGCFDHWDNCMRLESFLVSEYFKTLLEPAPGLLFAIVWFAYQPRAWLHVLLWGKELMSKVFPRDSRRSAEESGAAAGGSGGPPLPHTNTPDTIPDEESVSGSDMTDSTKSSWFKGENNVAGGAVESQGGRSGTSGCEEFTHTNSLSDDELVLLLSSKRQRGDVRQLSGSSVGGGSSFDSAAEVANTTTTTNPFAKRLSLEIQYEKNIHDEDS